MTDTSEESTSRRYLYRPTRRFTARLERVQKHDPPAFRRIQSVIERLLQHPDDADGRMHGARGGTFKKYVGRGEYRIIYYYCALCRKANRRLQKICEHCDALPDESVVFLDLFHKNEV